MPRRLWPGMLQRKSYVPGLRSSIRVAVLPESRVGMPFSSPAIMRLKLCGEGPALRTVTLTIPALTTDVLSVIATSFTSTATPLPPVVPGDPATGVETTVAAGTEAAGVGAVVAAGATERAVAGAATTGEATGALVAARDGAAVMTVAGPLESPHAVRNAPRARTPKARRKRCRMGSDLSYS